VLARSRPPRRPSVLTLVRGALALVGLAQVAIAAPLLLSGHDHAAPEHVAHEMGAFAMALGFGFLLAAWKPDRARGMHGLVGVAAVLLVVTAAVDLAHGRTDFGDEAPHVFAVVGWLLLGWLAVATPSRAAEAGTVSGTRHGGGVRHRRVPAMGASLRLGPRGAAESAPDGERRAG
jgi:peptidoglycan/LPS O-acetylase OafA/YrhL